MAYITVQLLLHDLINLSLIIIIINFLV